MFGGQVTTHTRRKLLQPSTTSNATVALASIAGGDQHAADGSEAKLAYGEGDHMRLTHVVG